MLNDYSVNRFSSKVKTHILLFCSYAIYTPHIQVYREGRLCLVFFCVCAYIKKYTYTQLISL